jgi:2-polyprenyl-3-methyl-5-hydroxy-6-metoxy-1,4-benzoquinol methylase
MIFPTTCLNGEIDFIFSSISLHEAIPADHQGIFDGAIASHVIQHYPDLRGFFETSAVVLKPDGILCLAAPHRRYGFHAFKPLARTVRCWGRQTAFENIAYNATSS